MSIRQIPRGWLYTAIRLLSLSALFFASMLAVDYYFNPNTFCHEGASCEVVANSEFGQKYGIFLPTLGLLAYSFFFLTSFFFAKTKLTFLKKKLSTFWVPLAIICCAIGALLFIVVQAFEINAFCWLCMGIDTSAILMVIPAIFLFLNKSEEDETPEKLAESPIFHVVGWIGLYLLAALGPLTWGSFQPPVEKVSTDVPAYIQSFYKPGKVNIVEISSFDCPHCRELHPQLSALLQQYDDHINFTRLSIPLSQRKEACVAYYCAEQEKKSEQYADCLFKEPSKESGKLLEYARECSINEDSFKSCLTDPKTSEAVDQMLENIRSIDFKGAPTVWIDNIQIIGFDKSKGMTPYKNAIEKNKSGEPTLPLAFIFTIIIGLGAIITGLIITFARRREG